MNTTSLDISIQLRDAGFPQPEIALETCGWYWATVYNDGPLIYAVSELRMFQPDSIREMIYAPNALELLPRGWHIEHSTNPDYQYRVFALYSPMEFRGDNGHDCAAKAWMWKNKPVEE